MLVTVAVLVIMMTILVQIFQAATGAVSAAQAFQQLDDQLRRIDGIIRADLEGVTARFTPPLDPLQNLGYFEYGENEFADNQGEDSDDYIRFTAKAPAGKPFTGRFWPNFWTNTNTGQTFGTNAANLPSFPITITSDYAEIIYFVRNGNLYRRVLLILPELQSAVLPTTNNVANYNNVATRFQPSIFGGPANNGPAVSWQGVNDLSARPSATGSTTNQIVLNTLGDLTNRENRAFMPRLGSDFLIATAAGNNAGQDGIPDDVNGDNIPDLYPSLYPGLFNPTNLAGQLIFAPPFAPNLNTGTLALTNNPGANSLAFPYVFPGAYSKAQALTSDAFGWIHAPAPFAVDATQPTPNRYQFDQQPFLYLQYLNHNPIDVGDNLPTPPNGLQGAPGGSDWQTWWGFPTWRETLSPNWNDPTVPVFYCQTVLNQLQPAGLTYVGALNIPGGVAVPANANLLPPMVQPGNFTGDFSIYRQSQQSFSDGAGQNSAFWTGANNQNMWALSWEDDLIMTGVRSFDVKAYDAALTNYADLGWGDDLRLYLPYQNAAGAVIPTTPPAINQTPPALAWPPINPQVNPITPVYPTLNTLAHEGRMPPLQNDHRLDFQNPNPTYLNYTQGNFVPQYPQFPLYSSNVGDDSNGIVRLRRVWDSWSTAYSRAPAVGVGSSTGGFPVGPPFSPPIYPSYPPPYPAPLRGIQIQIRVVDPTNQRIKSLTIRQDFTDKL
jgi:hypothetical protein